MSDKSIKGLIGELVAKAEVGDIEAATEILESIADRFDELRTIERSAIRRSAGARRSEDVEAQGIDALTEHIQAGADTQMSRAAFLLESVSILQELETEQTENATATQTTQQSASNELATLGNRIQTQQDEYDNTATNAAETTNKIEVPAQVSVESISAPNTAKPTERFNVIATIKNVGDQPAADVNMTIKSKHEGKPQSEKKIVIGELPGSEIKTASEEINGSETVIVTIKSSNGGSDRSETTILIESSSEPDESDDGLSRFDQDNTGKINRDDAIAAIVAYNTNDTIGGEPVSRDQAVNVIVAYNTGQPVE